VSSVLGFTPFCLPDILRRLAARIYDMGFAAVEKSLRYFLLGAVIVFPVWIAVRVFKLMGRTSGSAILDPPSRKREAYAQVPVVRGAAACDLPSALGGKDERAEARRVLR